MTKLDLALGILTLPPSFALAFVLGAAFCGYGAPARYVIAALS